MEIIYKKAVVTFIDILGFSEIVKTMSAEEVYNVLTLISSEAQSDFGGKMRHIINNYLSGTELLEKLGWTGVSNAPSLNVIRFSDSIVRIRFDEPSCEFVRDCVISEFTSLPFIQSRLMKMGILIRGAVTIGKIFYNEEKNIVYGPAMIRAYELERDIALYPRIIIDPKIANFCADMNDYDWKNNRDICIDFDGMMYIDYLDENPLKLEYLSKKDANNKEQIIYEIERISELRDYMVNLIQLIFNGNKAKKEISEKIAIKYSWIFTHYNRVCSNIYQVAKDSNYDGEYPEYLPINLVEISKNIVHDIENIRKEQGEST